MRIRVVAFAAVGSAMIMLAVSGLACAPTDNASAPADELATADLAAIRAASLAYPAAWLANDPEQVRAALTDDAVLMPSGGLPAVAGLPAIDEFFWPADAPPMTVTQFSMEPAEIAGTPALAYVRGTMSLTFDMEAEGTLETYTTAGNYLMVLRPGADQTWRIARYIWNHPPWERVAQKP